jgi:hypothetical protein
LRTFHTRSPDNRRVEIAVSMNASAAAAARGRQRRPPRSSPGKLLPNPGDPRWPRRRVTQQALSDQLQGADTDLLRRVLEHAMQRLIEAEGTL